MVEVIEAGDGDTWHAACQRLEAELDKVQAKNERLIAENNRLGTLAGELNLQLVDAEAENAELSEKLLRIAGISEYVRYSEWRAATAEYDEQEGKAAE